MSNFYNQASWVLIPSGIEEDIVFAQKPISGLGDLSFTRASDATYTDSTGVVRRSPYNLLQQSNTFNVTWGTAFATVTIGQTGYDGTNNAWLFSKSFADGRTSQNITLTSGAYTYSVYAKAGTKNWVFLRVDGTSNRTAYFNLLAGVTGTASGCNSSISPVGNGWYRCSITFTDSMTVARVYVADANNDTSGTSGNILIQAAQLVEGTSALDYFPTTNRQDVPRIDFRNADGTLSSCGRLLLEPQRTNSIRNSSMVGAVAPSTLPNNWARQNTSGLTQTIIGTGVENGLPYIDINLSGTATGANDAYTYDNTITASISQTWTNSWYFKLLTSSPNAVRLAMQEFNSGSFLNVVTQDITPTTNLARYTQTKTLVGAGVNNVRAMIYINFVVGQTYNTTIRIAAPQMELGAYATTWVPTTTAAVTRLADAFTRTNIFTNGLISAAGGTWFVEISDNASVLRDNGSGLFIGDTAFANNGNQIIIRSAAPAAAARFSIIRYISGTATTLHTTTTNKIKVAVKWNGSVMDVFVNGVKVSASNLFTTTTMQNMIAGAGQIFEIDQMSLASTPLSDAQCIQLTTL